MTEDEEDVFFGLIKKNTNFWALIFQELLNQSQFLFLILDQLDDGNPDLYPRVKKNLPFPFFLLGKKRHLFVSDKRLVPPSVSNFSILHRFFIIFFLYLAGGTTVPPDLKNTRFGLGWEK